MNILLVNDDGIESRGIWTLYEAMIAKRHNVWLVAPKTEKSATSHAITLRDPLRVEKVRDRVWSVTGTPVDCVIMAFEELLRQEECLQLTKSPTNSQIKMVDSINPDLKIDLVISGINAGPNRGDDVLYSGTVAAAIEAMCFGYKAIALSITSHSDQIYETAVFAINKLLENGIIDYIGHREIININVPNVAIDELKGFVVCQTGFRRYRDVLIKQKDNREKDIYWIGGYNPIYEISDYELDYFATKENKVSISPLKIDLTNYKKMVDMENWLKSIF
ncbi:MAG: 5'/3'-nucleotidase SurE [Candidatus Cloacimonetes bacterium]|nr:5'/3'-nucleotidase SurE [Candidatus Cloacimonadota bacterium]